MTSYNIYPSLPSAPPEARPPQSGAPLGSQVGYYPNILQAKQRGLKNKEQIFKQQYEKYNKILNRLMWLDACSSRISIATGISSVATFATFVRIPVSAAL